jgi:anaerobic carbon-monoxide dehydrogenase iron sulfur subunit
MKVIAVHLDRCTGCKTCELYCAVDRGSNGKTLLTAAQESPLPQARVRVEGNNELPIALQCRHCLKAPCVDACLTGALTRDAKTNMVVVQEDRCIACWTCTMFCPYGVIYPWPEREFALKCDRCAYMENPVCVEVCPCKALELVELEKFDEMLRRKRESVAGELAGENKKRLLVLDLD